MPKPNDYPDWYKEEDGAENEDGINDFVNRNVVNWLEYIFIPYLADVINALPDEDRPKFAQEFVDYLKEDPWYRDLGFDLELAKEYAFGYERGIDMKMGMEIWDTDPSDYLIEAGGLEELYRNWLDSLDLVDGRTLTVKVEPMDSCSGFADKLRAIADLLEQGYKMGEGWWLEDSDA